MIVAPPMHKIISTQIGKGKPYQILEGPVMRARIYLPGDNVEVMGITAIPVFVINDGVIPTEPFVLDPEEPIDLVIDYSVPVSGGIAIPVFLVEPLLLVEEVILDTSNLVTESQDIFIDEESFL